MQMQTQFSVENFKVEQLRRAVASAMAAHEEDNTPRLWPWLQARGFTKAEGLEKILHCYKLRERLQLMMEYNWFSSKEEIAAVQGPEKK